MERYFYRTNLNVAEKENYCGSVRCAILVWDEDKTWKETILGKNDPNYSLLVLSIYDEDDFGGPMIYAVPNDELPQRAEELKVWAVERNKTPIESHEWYESDFLPHLTGIKDYNNW